MEISEGTWQYKELLTELISFVAWIMKTFYMTWSMNMRMMMMMPQVTERIPASEEFFRRRMLLQTDLGLS